MRIEILYFEDCPNYKQAIGLVQEVLREERVSAQVTGSMSLTMRWLKGRVS